MSLDTLAIGYSSAELDAFAERAAQALGVEVCADLGAGADGIVYMLETGGCMKLTTSRAEAALAAMLIARRESGNPVAGVPEFTQVAEIVDAGEWPLYAVVREGVECPFPDPTPEEEADDRLLRTCLRYVAYAWTEREDDPESYYLYRVAMTEWGDRKPSLAAILPSLRSLRDDLGVTVADLHYDNFGFSDSGILCVRDFSRVDMDRKVLETALRGIQRIEAVPVPSL